jgi:spermidine/putrescine transport system ATP-binding protein
MCGAIIYKGKTMASPDLQCANLTKEYGDVVAVNNVSFDVPAGSFFSILGPSGCGKTTIMRMIAGFQEPTSGDIQIKGKSVLSVPPNKRPVNMVFQHLALFPMMNIAENIGYGLRRRRMDKSLINRKVDEALDRIGLPGIGSRKVDELSGGQKQRVAIARCMVLEPDVLLLDEPLGALDLKLREQMKVELKTLQAAFDTTFLYITHDQSEALVMSDNIAVMNAGRFEQVASAQDLYHNPKTAFVAGFVGDSNRWLGTVVRRDGIHVEIKAANGALVRSKTTDDDLVQGAKAVVYVRPESILVSQDAEEFNDKENVLSGEVEQILFNGAASRLLVRPDESGDIIEVTMPQAGGISTWAQGDTAHVGWSQDQSIAFVERAG